MSRFKEPFSGDVEVAHPDVNRDLWVEKNVDAIECCFKGHAAPVKK